MTDFLQINVGGKTRQISRTTFLKIPVFESVAEAIGFDALKGAFIDRDATLFDEVLSYVAWEIIPASGEVCNELEHYGIILDENTQEKERIEKLAEVLAEQLIRKEPPYYVWACEETFVTTKSRLSRIRFFDGLFNSGMKQLYAGSAEDPYRCEIPGKYFSNILAHLRDQRLELSFGSIAVLKVLGEVIEENKEENEENKGRPFPNSNAVYFDLASEGMEDKLLTSDPQMTLWRPQYKRTTKTAISRFCFTHAKVVEVPTEPAERHYHFRVSRIGDMIYQCYIKWCIKRPFFPHGLDNHLLSGVEFRLGGAAIQTLTAYQIATLHKMQLDHQDVEDFVHVPFFSAWTCKH